MADETQQNGEQTIHYESSRKKRKAGKPKMQPPLTPMIDVTFQLLLFFLLTFTFREYEGQIPGALPKKGTGQSVASTMNQPIWVEVNSRGATEAVYEIRGRNTAISDPLELYNVLKNMQDNQQSKEGPVVIAPDAYAPWRHVVEVFNQAIRLDFENVGFAPVGA